MKKRLLCLLFLLEASLSFTAEKKDSLQDISKQLANPVASIYAVPFELNTYDHIGKGENGKKTSLNIKPVIPIKLNDDWNLISRTITGFVNQKDYSDGYGSQWGMGDTIEQMFITPASLSNGWLLGLGPAFLLPTATDEKLGADKYGAGATGVVAKISGPWLNGVMAYHINSFSGSGDEDVNVSFIQPFINYNLKNGSSIVLNSETTYDHEGEDYEIPVNLLYKKVMNINGHIIQPMVGVRYYAADMEEGARGWGIRTGFTWLIPNKS